MGLTRTSTGKSVLMRNQTEKTNAVMALAGSPNVGKSTVFNALTGLHQHTGNWTGKTVETAAGTVKTSQGTVVLVDVPGMYSLSARSGEEAVARDFILFGGCDGVVVVCDALCFERNLGLVLQIAEATGRMAICLNLMDQAHKKGMRYDLSTLRESTGWPVVGCSAKKKEGLTELTDVMGHLSAENAPFYVDYGEGINGILTPLETAVAPYCRELSPRFVALRLLYEDDTFKKSLSTYLGVDFQKAELAEALTQANQALSENGLDASTLADRVSQVRHNLAHRLYTACVTATGHSFSEKEQLADRLITGKLTAFPLMFLLLFAIFWFTISGANVPSGLLADWLFGLEAQLHGFFMGLGVAKPVCDFLFSGVFRVLAWVVSVMLPPMAIFFPLFTLLEDIGFLPRMAFNLDKCFSSCHACGKQALTMC